MRNFSKANAANDFTMTSRPPMHLETDDHLKRHHRRGLSSPSLCLEKMPIRLHLPYQTPRSSPPPASGNSNPSGGAQQGVHSGVRNVARPSLCLAVVGFIVCTSAYSTPGGSLSSLSLTDIFFSLFSPPF
ncbi:hypothetical protein NPIL_451521 [Nephila pilipes]|uniref:Uncharacterized protein n=1 Tax=Nephila pilipes TaxID=299642 RepID=A0A8X6UM37_NEPPI|nr:hypothetical protein NPIL_451521 [Nephila pilipes]